MKKLLFFILVLTHSWNTIYSQVYERCGTMQHMEKLEQSNLEYKIQRQKFDEMMNTLSEQPAATNSKTLYTIPVVVHVVYKTALQNISDAQILSQIEVLNEDFRRLNLDASNTPAAFLPVAADCQIQFCLAQKDPNGNATNGIERRLTTANSFIDDDKVKFYSSGGLDQWDPTKYFNIWVCNLAGGLLGYAELPTFFTKNTYGVVVGYQYFGRGTGTLSPPYNKGRTATHEIGHCFNLRHIWGDASCGNDFISDTPLQQGANYNCPTFPKVSSCSGNPPNGDMFMNYMDYTDDACMNIFTQGQSTRMRNVLNINPYKALTTSDACSPPVVSDDAGVLRVESPKGSLCETNFTPLVYLKNYGINTLNQVDIKYKVNSASLQTFNWTGSLISGDSTLVTLNNLTATPGNNSFEAYTENPNGVADQYTANDLLNVSFNVINPITLPVFEGFESTTFPANGWDIFNFDNDYTWQRTTLASKTGVASAHVNNYLYDADGEIDELISPVFNTSSFAISFDLAYQLYNNPSLGPGNSDTLLIYGSSDCGNSWHEIYKKYGADLTTVIPNFSISEFYPSVSTDWRTETTHFYLPGNTGMFKFVNISDYENNIFIDNINITDITSVSSNLINSFFKVYPNPAHNEMVIESDENIESITIYDVLGGIIYLEKGHYRKKEIDLHDVPVGTYFIQIEQNHHVSTVKFVKL